MTRLFGDVHPARTEHPPVNAWTGTDNIILTAELPGIEPDDLDISVQGNSLMLHCTMKESEVQDGIIYHRRERTHGAFARSWQLPVEVDGDRVDARLENGVLRLTLPKAESHKPRKVRVKAAEKGGKTA